MRVVCKEGFARDMADMLIGHLKWGMDYFAAHPHKHPRKRASGFHH